MFGHIGYHQPKEMCGPLASVLYLLFSCLDVADPGLKAVAIETVGHIGSTADGKMALSKQGEYCLN